MNVSDYFSYPIVSALVGGLIGFLANLYNQSRQNQRSFFYNQLDRLYGPVYAQIRTYQINRQYIDGIKEFNWKGENRDFFIGNKSNIDDSEVMAEWGVREGFISSEKILNIITSNIIYARKEDKRTIELFIQQYWDHVSTFGSDESPSVFSNYFESTKLPNDFIETMINSYLSLIEKI